MVFRYSTMDGFVDKPLNNFKNDGSFLETFKKLQSGSGAAASSRADKEECSSSSSCAPDEESGPSGAGCGDQVPAPKAKPVPPMIGKRRGGRVLPTGKVKKSKTKEEQESEELPKDAWSVYLREVKKYRETTCQEEDDKTRPLVK